MRDATARIERVLGVGITGLTAMVMIGSTVRVISQIWGVKAIVTAPYIPLEVAGVDHDNDGILSDVDIAAFEAAFGAREDSPSYERRFDINFDGIINDWDRDVFYTTCQEVPNLEVVRSDIETGIYQQLIWPDGEEAWLVALVDEPALVQKFTGTSRLPGWIHIHHHPWFSDVKKMEFYLCQHFSLDTTVAAYKALGYGRILPARTIVAPGHTYNIFWIGGDWQDLNNWRVLEPQSGAIFNAANENLPSQYHTGRILFPCHSSLGTYGQQWHFHTLRVGFAEKVVSYGTDVPPSSVGEEPKPDEVIITLGIRSLP